MPALKFSTLRAADLLAIERDSNCAPVLGLSQFLDIEEAEAAAAENCAWSVYDTSPGSAARLIACFGIVETFPGSQGWGWALLAPRLGMAHFQLTRFIQGQVAHCGLARLELLAKGPDLEPWIAAAGGEVEPDEVMRLAWKRSTPEMRWAVLLGLKPAHVLRQFGGARETYVLFERLSFDTRPAGAAQDERSLVGEPA